MLREIRCSCPENKQGSLRMKKELLNGQDVRMQLWENSSGDLFILLNTVVNSERLMVQTDVELLMDFFGDHITLGDLVYYSPSPFALLVQPGGVARLYLPDAEVKMCAGEAYFSEVKATSKKELA